MLYPRNTPTRARVSLDGVWNFKLLDSVAAYNTEKPLLDCLPMPVPSAYNDIYEGREYRDHVGWMVYERLFSIPEMMQGSRLLLHFGSVTHNAQVWLNGQMLGTHDGGFLPFEFDISSVALRSENRLTVLVNNIVNHSTLPCGTLQNQMIPGINPRVRNFPNFDFFNYSGIMRPVSLYVVPFSYISHIALNAMSDGFFNYNIMVNGKGTLKVQILDEGTVLWEGNKEHDEIRIPGVTAWSPEIPKLYCLRVLLNADDKSLDVYDEWFGFRDVVVRDCSLYLNGKPLYLKGFGKHEDAPVHGRGFAQAYNVKDLALMKWMGSNSFRTSHYPYSEEMLYLCDRMGILVIDEAPAVGMHTTFTATGMKISSQGSTWETLQTQQHHLEVMRSLIARDQNHPCVIMWSVANEPASEEPGAYRYFEPIFTLTRKLDPQHRPVTFAAHGESGVDTCEVTPLCDVINLNRYYGWYSEEGDIVAAKARLSDELDKYHKRYPDKPIMLCEFGADAISGFHDTTPLMFSEEYQCELIRTYCGVLDEKEYICGEHVWNFADFATAESVKRVQGNKKGVFSRERKPKLAVWYLKERWTAE